MGQSLRLHRHADGTLSCGNPEPPARLDLPTRWVNAGGVPGPLADRAAQADSMTKEDINCDPLFDRDGTSIVFDFVNHGVCRYDLVAIDDRGKVLSYKLAMEG